MLIYGTRPEAIKLAPIIAQLKSDPHFQPIVAVTGQHREMLDQINEGFGIEPDIDLDIFAHGQSLGSIAAKTVMGVESALAEHKPRAVIVQGDTSSAFVAGLAAFYARVPVVHVEAGLRTPTIDSPFPEEGNRRLLTRIAALHLAPTAANRDALERESVSASDIVVTGNPVIDALHEAVSRSERPRDQRVARALASPDPVVLVTSHRRESLGDPMANTAAAIRRLALLHPHCSFVFPLHANPLVRETFRPVLEDLPNVILTDPLGYFELAHVLSRCTLVLTDSGGIQEEAPALGVPVVVLREETERVEGVVAGTAVLVGTHTERIVDVVHNLLTDAEAHRSMAESINPYGDGRAAERTVQALAAFLGLGSRPAEFMPGRRRSHRHAALAMEGAA